MTPPIQPQDTIALTELRRGESATVEGLCDAADRSTTGNEVARDPGLLQRLRDLGFINGARCEVIARMWLGSGPIAVRVGGSTFALRRIEAAAVRVHRLPQRAADSAFAPAT